MIAAMDGFLLIDKPAGRTSRQVCTAIARMGPVTKVGHSGTLDPGATGLLILGLGKALKFIQYVEALGKEYDVHIRLGMVTDTLDRDGRILETRSIESVTPQAIRHTIHSLIGTVSQKVPVYSAIKVSGRPLYERARRGEKIDPPVRTVIIESIDLLECALPILHLRVRCGKGTYIRALARDIGERLGCGACVESLRRTAIGLFHVEQAVHPEEWRAEPLQPIDALLGHLDSINLSEEQERGFRCGRSFPLAGPTERVRVYGSCFLGVGRREGQQLIPEKVAMSCKILISP